MYVHMNVKLEPHLFIFSFLAEVMQAVLGICSVHLLVDWANVKLNFKPNTSCFSMSDHIQKISYAYEKWRCGGGQTDYKHTAIGI